MWHMDMRHRCAFWIRKPVRLEQLVAAHDVGKAVNPLSCEGQIEGGVVMSMGLCTEGTVSDLTKTVNQYPEVWFSWTVPFP